MSTIKSFIKSIVNHKIQPVSSIDWWVFFPNNLTPRSFMRVLKLLQIDSCFTKLWHLLRNSPLSQLLPALPLCAAIKARGCEEDLSQSSQPPLLVATSARTTSHLSAVEIYVAVQKEANPARQCWVGLVLRWQLCVWYCSWLSDRLWPGVSEICHKWKLEKVRTVQSR